jgi:hypothetical protein
MPRGATWALTLAWTHLRLVPPAAGAHIGGSPALQGGWVIRGQPVILEGGGCPRRLCQDSLHRQRSPCQPFCYNARLRVSEMPPREAVSVTTQHALKTATPSMRELAEEAGLTYSTLRAWSAGNRSPSAEHVRALARALKNRAARLQELAEELDKAAGDTPGA